MTIDRDDRISLPGPPPPRPAARRAAIDAAMRHFDGIEAVPAERAKRKRPSLAAWATTYRGPAGGLVAAALVAIVFIPAIPFVLRDSAPRVVTGTAVPDRAGRGRDLAACTGAECAGRAASGPGPARTGEAVAPAPSPPVAQPVAPPAGAATERRQPQAAADDRETPSEPSASFLAAPPPPPPPMSPPPPPPAPAPQAEAGGDIVVSGSRISAANRAPRGEDAARDSAKAAATRPAEREPFGAFLSLLQAGLEANDRQAIGALIGFPLRVEFESGAQLYRSPREVERDFDRIFTPRVTSGLLGLRPGSLDRREGGRLRGSPRLWFGCGATSCSRDAPVRIREVRP